MGTTDAVHIGTPCQQATSAHAETFDYGVVRQFTIATVFWGVVGMGVGLFIALQLIWPQLNFEIPWLTYGRLRPVHTNLVIFAFGGSALFATSYYVAQRTCQTRIFSPGLARFTFWGWQLAMFGALVTLPLGFTSTKEYAELEWPLDILVAVVWVSYAIVFFGTLAKRRVRHIYVANWFYGSFILTIAVLYIFNNLDISVSMLIYILVYVCCHVFMVQLMISVVRVWIFLQVSII